MARRHPSSAVEIVDEDGFVQNPALAVTAGFPSGRAAPVQGTPGMVPVEVVGKTALVQVDLTLDTAIYADNDVLADTQEVMNVLRAEGGTGVLQSLVMIDADDQAQDIDLIFLSGDGSIGTENSAVTAADLSTLNALGVVQIIAADYVDMINAQFATKTNLGMVIKVPSGSRSLWVAAVLRSGTPTYTRLGLRLRLGILLD